jgi:hypothetical protein
VEWKYTLRMASLLLAPVGACQHFSPFVLLLVIGDFVVSFFVIL